MAKKFVEPINDEFYGWVSPDGSVQMMLLAPDIPTLFGVTKLTSQKGISQTAKEMSNKGFTLHKLKIVVENVDQVVLDGKLMADLLDL